MRELQVRLDPAEDAALVELADRASAEEVVRLGLRLAVICLRLGRGEDLLVRRRGGAVEQVVRMGRQLHLIPHGRWPGGACETGRELLDRTTSAPPRIEALRSRLGMSDAELGTHAIALLEAWGGMAAGDALVIQRADGRVDQLRLAGPGAPVRDRGTRWSRRLGRRGARG